MLTLDCRVDVVVVYSFGQDLKFAREMSCAILVEMKEISAGILQVILSDCKLENTIAQKLRNRN